MEHWGIKKIAGLVLALLLCVTGFSQNTKIVVDRLEVKQSMKLVDKTVTSVSVDSSFGSATHAQLPTAQAVKKFVDSSILNIDSLMKAATANGFLTANSIPYVDANGRLDARGFEEFGSLGSAPSAPGSGFRFYADASGRLAWKGSNGYVRVFDGIANSADRVYTLPNASGTVGLFSSIAANQIAVGNDGNTLTSYNTFVRLSSGFVGHGTASPTSFMHVVPSYSGTGDLSGAGYFLRIGSATATNTTTPNAGTVASASLTSFEGGTIASTNNVIYTNLATVRITGAPTAGAFSTITNSWALRVDAGASSFVDKIIVGNNASTYTTGSLDVLARGDSPGIRLYSGQNANGGSVNAPNISFFRSTSATILSASARFQITPSVNGADFDGFTFSSPNSSITWTAATVAASNLGLSFPSGVTQAVRNYQLTYFSADLVVGLDNGAGTPPQSGVIRSGQKNDLVADITGSNLTLQAGRGNGNISTNGNIILQTPDATVSGTALQTYTTKFQIGRTLNYSVNPFAVGVTTIDAAALMELSSTTKGFLGTRATDAQIAAMPLPPNNLRTFSSTTERQNIRRTGGWYQEAFIQDIKRDTVHKTVNANLDLSGLTATWKNRSKRVTIETIITAAATGNNTITMPTPTADLVGIRFDVSVEDTSGDSDISVLSFGTDGTDGYLYNGDGTYSPSQNLYPGLGVYFGVYWCEAKSAYRWKLQ